MEAAIEVTDLVVERGKRRVLHGISCAVQTGSVTGLLGPSGSGKTTLIRAIVGVQIVKSGTVTVLGLPAGVSRQLRRIGSVGPAEGGQRELGGVPAPGTAATYAPRPGAARVARAEPRPVRPPAGPRSLSGTSDQPVKQSRALSTLCPCRSRTRVPVVRS